MKTLYVYANGQWNPVSGGSAADLSAYATTAYVDSQISGIPAPDLSQYAKLADPEQEVTARSFEAKGIRIRSFPDTGAMGAVGITDLGQGNRLGVSFDGKAPTQLAWVTDLDAKANQSDLSAYAKITDTDQVLTTKSVIAQGFAFDPNAVIKIHDTGEGYGPRLSYITVEGSNPPKVDFIALKSDLEPVIKDLEEKKANQSDLLALAAEGAAKADLNNPNQDIVTKTIEALKFSFAPDKAIVSLVSGESERPVYRAGTKNFPLAFTTELTAFAKITDMDQVLTTKSVIAQGFAFDPQHVIKIHDTGEGYGPRVSYIYEESGQVKVEPFVLKSDLDPINALLPRVEAMEGKIASPVGTADINDPALAEFRAGILTEVAKMLAGSDKKPPADIPWTDCLAGNGSAQTQVQARMIGGIIELKGIRTFGTTNSSFQVNQLPASFPLPEMDAAYPIAAREAGVSARYAYVSITKTSRVIGLTMAGNINEATLSGVRFKAAY